MYDRPPQSSPGHPRGPTAGKQWSVGYPDSYAAQGPLWGGRMADTPVGECSQGLPQVWFEGAWQGALDKGMSPCPGNQLSASQVSAQPFPQSHGGVDRGFPLTAAPLLHPLRPGGVVIRIRATGRALVLGTWQTRGSHDSQNSESGFDDM